MSEHVAIVFLRRLDMLFLDCDFYERLFTEQSKVNTYNREFPFSVSRIQVCLEYHILMTLTRLIEGEGKLTLLSVRKVLCPQGLSKQQDQMRQSIQEKIHNSSLVEWRNRKGAHFELDSSLSSIEINPNISTDLIKDLVDEVKFFVSDMMRSSGKFENYFEPDRRTGSDRDFERFIKRLVNDF
ncbi:hypothetical protein [Reinekea blandensis]|uniref:HEPN AbiU2-like domain-containing protein n=1 Tax=Reinekea blandensis MED297 TaxID=314283 RepID=A4BF21_9GAMM|nr:hypothetical protein [Reinekea blandensis]EAR09356.1 hypothetical protein MED297_18748 [Reinekea sp. MED297] [Reinekea blandensis MED297]